jgi:hypothetical protein
MFCQKCGKENKDDARFCLSCGNAFQSINSQKSQNPSTINNQGNNQVNQAQANSVQNNQGLAQNNLNQNSAQVNQIPNNQNSAQPIVNQNNSQKKKVIFIISMVAVLIFGLIILFLISFQKSDDNLSQPINNKQKSVTENNLTNNQSTTQERNSFQKNKDLMKNTEEKENVSQSGMGTKNYEICNHKNNFYDEMHRYSYNNQTKEVFYADKKIDGADQNTFTPICDNEGNKSSYAKDKNNVYHKGVKIKEADVSSFQLLIPRYYWFSYAKDKNNVYFRGDRLSESGTDEVFDIDPNTFQILGVGHEGYSKDKNGVYYINTSDRQYMGHVDMKIEGADPESFRLLHEGKDREYYKGIYTRDKNHIFCYEEMLVGADPESFKVDLSNPHMAKDKYRSYNDCK